MNNENLNGYCNKLINLYNYTRIDVGIFKQNCVNWIQFSIAHVLMWKF